MKRVSLLPSGKALRFLTGTVGIAAAIAAANPGAAQASTTPKGTTAAAKIVNQVAVTYYDNTGVGTQYTRKAATTVTVALVQSPLNVAALTANTSIDAGGSAVYNYTITSTANGSDYYKINTAFGTATNLSSYQAVFTITVPDSDTTTTTYTKTISNSGLTTDWLNAAGAPAGVQIGAATVIGSNGSNTLYFPG